MGTFYVFVDYSSIYEIVIKVWDKKNAQNITLNEFRDLDWDDMQSYVHSDAVKLAEIQYDEEHGCTLYQLPNFYVEIKYYKGTYVEEISSFDDTNPLDPYLEQIKIEGL